MNAGSAGRSITDEADARACLAAVAASGVTLFTWARENGVSTGHLYRWRQLVAGLDGRGIRDEADARRLLASWARSGRSFAEWCRAEKVSMEALRQWRRRIDASRRAFRPAGQRTDRGKDRGQVPAIRLVEITTSAGVAPPPVQALARYEIQVRRCRVLVGNDFDDAALTRLLRVASAC